MSWFLNVFFFSSSSFFFFDRICSDQMKRPRYNIFSGEHTKIVCTPEKADAEVWGNHRGSLNSQK